MTKHSKGIQKQQQAEEHICLCPLKGVIDVIGKKWALLVVNAIGNHGRLRHKELMHEIRISPRTLSDTLKDLERWNLIGRQSFNEIPPRVEYYLTDKGRELRKAVVPLLEWASKMTKAGNFESCCTTRKSSELISITKKK